MRQTRGQMVHQRFMSHTEDQVAWPPILCRRKRIRRGEKEGGGSSSQGQASGSGSGAPQSAADFADEMRITMFRLGVDNRPMSEQSTDALPLAYLCQSRMGPNSQR